MSISLIILLFSSILILSLGVIALTKSSGNKQNLYFFFFTVALIVWIVPNYFANFVNSLTLFNNRLTFLGTLLAMYFLYRFSCSFPDGEKKRNQIVYYGLMVITVIVSILTLFTPAVVSNYKIISTGTTVNSGSLLLAYVAYIIIVAGMSVVTMLKKRSQLEGAKRKQIDFILFGFSLSFIAGITMNLILPILFNNNNFLLYTPYSTIFFAGAAYYAIATQKLFDIKVLFAGLLVGLINLGLIAEIFTSNSTSELFFRIFIQVLITIGSFLLIQNVQQEISRREEIEKLAKEEARVSKELEARNKNLSALQRVSDIVLEKSEMAPMVQSILDELPNQLEDCFGAILSIVDDGRLVAYSYSKNHYADKIKEMIGEDLSKFSYPLRAGFNKLHDSLLEKKLVGSDSIADFISPPIPKPAASMLGRMIGAKYMEALPLQVNNQPFGVLLLIFTVDKEKVNPKNLEIANSIAGEFSIALQRTETLQQLKDANIHLTEIDKMKDEFLSMASHELNTPLAAIEGYISMILDEHMGKVDAQSRTYLQRAYDSSKRLAALVIDLLNVSRIEQGRLKMKFALTNMLDLAESVRDELQLRADAKKIYLKVEGDKKKLPSTWCDPDRIRGVIVNLAGNAIKFTDKGGITISAVEDNGFIKVSVRDTGRGISKENQKLLFQKFSQVNRATDEHQGTGLGLYISKNFIELHKGKLTVESEEGKGANFSFELPILKKAPEKIEGAVLEKPGTGLEIAPVEKQTTAPTDTTILTTPDKPAEPTPAQASAETAPTEKPVAAIKAK